MTKKKLFIFGVGSAAEVAYSIAKELKFNFSAFVVDQKFRNNKKLLNEKILTYEEIKKNFNPKKCKFFVAMGYTDMNANREKIYNRIKNDGFDFVNLIQDRKQLSKTVTIGDNCLIMKNSIIHPYVNIQNNNFLWGGSILCHHVSVKSHCWFTAGSAIAGNSVIDNNCFFGVNSSVTNNIRIGKSCFIGARVLINKNLKSNSVVISKPENKYLLNSKDFVKMIKNQF